ncbi:MAG: DNA alkylation repair protein [Actinomycetota bacterium]
MLPPFDDLRAALADVADPDKAPGMAAYMKDHFVYFGVQSKDRRAASKPWLRASRTIDADVLLDFAEACWSEREREFQYVGMDALRAGANNLPATALGRVRRLVETKSWWDTVDALAAWTVGPMVANHDLGSVMDEWIDDPNMWVARTAILHQLGFKEDTDAERLDRYVGRRADDTEFFIRKALGWALRNFSRIDSDAVRAIVERHDDRLSGLTRREATKYL